MSFRVNHQILQSRERIAEALRRTGMAAKQIARIASVSERTVENWKSLTTGMSADALAALCHDNDIFWAEFCAVVQRPADADAAARFLDDFNEWRRAKANNAEG